MHHLIVNRRADGLGEAAVIQRGRNRARVTNQFLRVGIQVSGGHIGLHRFPELLHHIIEQMSG